MFMARLQTLFDDRTKTGCVDASTAAFRVRSRHSSGIAETYIKVRPTYRCQLSCNDYYIATPLFAASLKGIVRLNQTWDARAVRVEAAAPDVFPDGFPTYRSSPDWRRKRRSGFNPNGSWGNLGRRLSFGYGYPTPTGTGFWRNASFRDPAKLGL